MTDNASTPGAEATEPSIEAVVPESESAEVAEVIVADAPAAPEPVAPDDQNGSLLGATYWGRTVSAGFDSWEIQPDEQPGIVCGVFKEDSVGSSIEVQGDSIGEPVLANANASMTITVV